VIVSVGWGIPSLEQPQPKAVASKTAPMPRMPGLSVRHRRDGSLEFDQDGAVKTALLALACVLCFACTDDDGGDAGDGGSADVPQDMLVPDLPNIDRWSPDWPGACDPTDQNCGGGDECTLDCTAGTFACTASTGGTKTIDQACGVGECARGLTCVGTCKKWCREDKDCPMGKTCSIKGVMCPGASASIGWLCFP